MSNTMHEYEGFVRNLMGSDKNERSTYALGLAGEAGEVCDLLKKHWGHKHPLDREKLCKELGDVLWYVAAIAVQHGISLRDVAHANVEKLSARYPKGFSPEASLARVDVAADTQRAAPRLSPSQVMGPAHVCGMHCEGQDGRCDMRYQPASRGIV
jgi:NTP pyrophosphatase (non-canonical NTP hydrolase)